jgi:uncharacterized protein YbbK (DUF523 family)
MKILVSACLLGVNCRYDGRSKPNEKVMMYCKKHVYIPVCPEVLGGLPTPRLRSEIKNGKVINEKGIDVTEYFEKGAGECLKIAMENQIDFAILKSKSPSCGCQEIYDGSFTGNLIQGKGICANLLIKNKIRVIDENDL